jgi:hypothetical protein
MQDTLELANTVSKSSFSTTLIISEIVITAIVLYGFYRIFNSFNNKQKAFLEEQKKEKNK